MIALAVIAFIGIIAIGILGTIFWWLYELISGAKKGGF